MTAADWEAYVEASAYGDAQTCQTIARREHEGRESCHGSDVPMRHADKCADSRKMERLATRRGLARMVTSGWHF
jgi:hypothetical protein